MSGFKGNFPPLSRSELMVVTWGPSKCIVSFPLGCTLPGFSYCRRVVTDNEKGNDQRKGLKNDLNSALGHCPQPE